MSFTDYYKDKIIKALDKDFESNKINLSIRIDNISKSLVTFTVGLHDGTDFVIILTRRTLSENDTLSINSSNFKTSIKEMMGVRFPPYSLGWIMFDGE